MTIEFRRRNGKPFQPGTLVRAHPTTATVRDHRGVLHLVLASNIREAQAHA